VIFFQSVPKFLAENLVAGSEFFFSKKKIIWCHE